MADAGYRLAVEGEKEFKKALAEINAQIKASKSELKLLTAEYEINDDKLSGLQKTQSALADTMAQQAEKVKIAEERYRAWADELGDGDEKVLKLKEALNLAKTELAKSTAEWQKNEEAIRAYGDNTESVEDSLRKIEAAISANQSELKLLAAQYGESADSSEAFAKKNAVVADSVEKQKSKIDLLQKALREAEEEFGDNSVEVLNYKKQLADANTELIEMEDNIRDNNDALEEGGGEGIEKMQDGLSSITDMLGVDMPAGIDQVISGITGGGGMVSGFGLAAAGVGAIITLVKELRESIKEAAAKSSEIIDTSSVYGMTTDELQEWQYAAVNVGIEIESVADAFKELKNKMYEAKTGNDEYKEAFRMLNVEFQTENGELRKTGDVFDELLLRYSGIENETERAALMMQMFGEEAQKLSPILDNGVGVLNAYKQQARELGVVLGEDLLSAMDALDRKAKRQEFLKEAEDVARAYLNNMRWERLKGNATYEDVLKASEMYMDAHNAAIQNRAMNLEESLEVIEQAEEEITGVMEESAVSAEEIAKRSAEASEYAIEQVEELTDAAQKAYADDIKAAQKAADEKLKAYQKSLNAELDALDERHAAELKAVEKNNAALLKSVQKSQKERQKALEASLDAEMEALEAQHREKLALIDAEYAERLKLLDNDQRKAITDIDAEIEAIEAVTAAEEAARKEKQQQEEIAALEKAVSEAQSREEKEEAERELSEYLLELERERILAEREANIAALEAKKELLEAEYDAQKEEIEAEKAATIEGLEAEFDAEKSLLETQHQERRDMLAEELALELDVYRENMSARVDELRKEQKNERDVLAASIAERVGNYKTEVQKEVDAEKEAAEDRLDVAKKNAEDMMVVWEDYYMKFKAILDSSAAEARAAGEKFATEFAGGIGAAMLAQEKSEGFAEGRLARGALMQGMNSGDFPDLAAAQNYTAAVAGQLSQAGGALNAGTGTVYNYNVTVEAKNIKELNDIVRLVENERMDTRMR